MNSKLLSQMHSALRVEGFLKAKYVYLVVFLFTMSFTHTYANTVYTWTGATSTEWSDSTNWSPMSASGGPNGCDVDVEIPVTANSPVLSSTIIIVGNMHLYDNARLTLKASLQICHNWTGGTTSYATVIGPGVVQFSSSSPQTISGITQMPELHMDNPSGVVMLNGAVLDLFVSLDIKSGNFDASLGSLTFKSNAADSVAFFDDFTEGSGLGTLTGNVTVERYFASSATYNQHFLGSPVNSPALTQFGASGTAGFVQNPTCDETRSAISSPYGNMFTLNESNGSVCGLDQWEFTTSGNAQNMQGFSYLYTGAGKLVLNGGLNVDTAYTMSGLTNSGWTNTSLQGHTYNSGWQLISNPYLAEIDLTQPQAGFDNQVQVWNAEGPYAGSYQPMLLGTNANIAPFQAFMVHKTNAGGGGAYTIAASERTRNVSMFYAQNANQLSIVATNTANGMLDQTTVLFNPAATTGFDSQYDAVKFPGALNRHTIYTGNNDMWMAINTLPDVSIINVVPMGFEAGATGTYTLAFNGLTTFDPTVYIMLEDLKTHVMYNIRNGNYTFNADSADAWNRFVLHFNPPVQVTTVDAGCAGPGTVKIAQLGIASWNYTLTDNNNNVISTGTVNQSQPASITASAGSYTLTLTDANNYTVVKTITVNGVTAATAAFALSDNTITAGETLTLTASEGNTTYQWNFGDGTTAIGVNASVSYAAPGTYTITLFVENEAGCSATSAQTISVSGTTGVTAVTTSNRPNIWSNSNTVYVDFNNAPDVDAAIIIYDILGRQISNDRMSSSLHYQHQISNINQGYFIVTVVNDNVKTTKKVLITNAE